jgi:lysozyme family protein
MLTAKFQAVLPITLGYEGGFSIVRSDPGNWTGGKVGRGQLKGTLKGIAASSHPGLDIKNLSDQQIASIYEAEYWRPIRGDMLPAGVDLSTFDFAVNSGVGRSAKALQKAAGVAQDGAVGPATIAAVATRNPVALIRAINDGRLGFLQSLAIWKTFGKGWGARVGSVRARSLLMAGATATVLRDEAATDTKKAATDSKAGGGAVAGGVSTGGGAVAANHAGSIDWVALGALGIAALIVVFCGIVLYRRAAARQEMAEATLAVAAEAT